ncbi:MAG: threonine transporter RhtB [Desulfobacteraceae bacterium 4484_190.3]|nr:MAG: threonine transporter RhtB [Desulfobacteraceae bacterium 4484_190.3]
MIPVETLAAFFTASVLLALAPGPDNIFVLTQSALYGKLPGLLVTLGLCTGLIVHTSAVAFGVAVIFRASAPAFTALKLFGAGYLLYLAWGAFRSSAAEIKAKTGDGPSLGSLYRRGIIMNVTNPKVSIFFLAFLPQFADPARGLLTLQMIILGAVFILSTILVFGTIGLLAGNMANWLARSDKAQIIMNRVAGTVFIALALKLATTER